MVFVPPKDRVRETTTTTGPADFDLAGAQSGFDPFSDHMSNGDTCWYAAALGGEWEVGLGTKATGQLQRTTILASSNAGAKVSFSAGVKDIWMDAPSAALLGQSDISALLSATQKLNMRSNSGVALCRKQNGLTPHENLAIKYVTAGSITVTADALTLFDSGGSSKRFTSLNVSPTPTTSGANGLDIGTEAISTRYTLYGMGKEDGTVATLISASSTSPTLPSGYTYFGKIGRFYNDASGDIVPFTQRGGHVSVDETTHEILTNGTATSATTIPSATAKIPDDAVELDLSLRMKTTSGTVDGVIVLNAATSGSLTDKKIIQILGITSGATVAVPYNGFVLQTPQSFQYTISGANAQLTIRVSGWRY